MIFKNAEWIWNSKDYGENEYSEFVETLYSNGEKVIFRISVCGDYTLFINGKYAESNQYGDFPHYKIYDEIDITEFLVTGENRICILAWYFGKSGMRYHTPIPGLIFEAESGGNIIISSNENTLSRKSNAYKSGDMKKISPQLGYSFTYDSNNEDSWLTESAEGFSASVILKDACELFKRPTEKLRLMHLEKGVVLDTGTSYIIDLGREIVGLPYIRFITTEKQKINVAYGEILENGHVKRKIGERDFSFDYYAKQGENEYTNYMLRFACRYMEITTEKPVCELFAGVIPQYYPAIAKKMPEYSEEDAKIYEICLNTLKLSMMEHYVDCPWREQCLYAYDSRNQMLTGYIAFEDKNAEYARANLSLIGKDIRDDELLSICFPSNENLAIPSFSLYYILAVKEYMEYTGDLSLGREVFEKIGRVLSRFVDNRKNGLVTRIAGNDYWNFYDWSDYCVSEFGGTDESPDLMINCIVLMALESYDRICKYLGENNMFDGIACEIKEKARVEFYNEETWTFFIKSPEEKPTELVNSLAVLTGVAGDLSNELCLRLARGDFASCSLSMKGFKYDAMLLTDKEKYRSVVLDEIRRTYKIMVDSGTGTVWETIDGAKAFDNAGSLCHGWSAIPIYYFDLLK